MITSLWNNVVLLSLIGSVMYLAIWVFGKIFRKTPARIKVLLYGLLALRLVIPYSWSYTLPFHAPYSWIEFNRVQTNEINLTNLNDHPADSSSEDGSKLDTNAVANPASQLSASDLSAVSSSPSFDLFGWIWLGGMALTLGYGLIRWIQLQKRLATAIRYTDRIWIADQIEDPFVWGLFQWKIMIPSSADSSTYDSIQAHEIAHIQRLDPLWKAISYFLLAIYWFNPILWLAYSSFNKEIEKACDEKAIRDMDACQKVDYAKALVQCSLPAKRRFLLLVPCFGNLGLKERISLIHTPQKLTKTGWIGAIVLSMGLAGCLGVPDSRPSTKVLMAMSDTSTWYSSLILKPEDKTIRIQSSSVTPELKIQAVSLENNRPIGQIIQLDSGHSMTLSDVTSDFRLWVQRVKPGDPEDQNEVELDVDGASIVEVYQAIDQVKTPYVGNVSAVGKVLNALPYPPDWTRVSCSMQTDVEPYGMSLYFDLPGPLSMQPSLLENCAIFAFSAIENLGTIEFINNQTDEVLAAFNRDQVMNRIQVKIGSKDVAAIEANSGPRGEGMSYAGGSLLQPGEIVTFNELIPGSTIEIEAFDQNRKSVFSKKIQLEELKTHDIVDGDWIISLIPKPAYEY
ncbi:DUF4825 domain-containing protein [Erysipelotrichaceae bacterium RD49]|nr:DUF4825 domain-containing protein [Erysipelotrichaceae bacterium RD49]